MPHAAALGILRLVIDVAAELGFQSARKQLEENQIAIKRKRRSVKQQSVEMGAGLKEIS